MTTPAKDPNSPVVTPAPSSSGRKQGARSQALHRALKRAADLALRHDDAAEAANEALVLLRAEFLWRFELLRSRQSQPVLIVPEQVPPPATVTADQSSA